MEERSDYVPRLASSPDCSIILLKLVSLNCSTCLHVEHRRTRRYLLSDEIYFTPLLYLHMNLPNNFHV